MIERSYCYRKTIDRFSKELSTNFVETLRNYKENQFDYKRNGKWRISSRWRISTANSTLESMNRSDDSAFDFNGDPEESRKPRRTFSDNHRRRLWGAARARAPPQIIRMGQNPFFAPPILRREFFNFVY